MKSLADNFTENVVEVLPKKKGSDITSCCLNHNCFSATDKRALSRLMKKETRIKM